MKLNCKCGFFFFFLGNVLKSATLGLIGAKVMRDAFVNINTFVSRCASPSGGWWRVCCLHVELEGEWLSDSAGAPISGHEQSIHQGKKYVLSQFRFGLHKTTSMGGINEAVCVYFSHFLPVLTAWSAPGLNMQRAPRSERESAHSQRTVGGGGADMQRLHPAQEE